MKEVLMMITNYNTNDSNVNNSTLFIDSGSLNSSISSQYKFALDAEPH